jgi:hypothetical protein
MGLTSQKEMVTMKTRRLGVSQLHNTEGGRLQ